jgi:hypothetical protein
VPVLVKFTVFLDQAGVHLGIAVDFTPLKPFLLKQACLCYPSGYRGRAFSFTAVRQITVGDGRNFNMQVNPIQQWP